MNKKLFLYLNLFFLYAQCVKDSLEDQKKPINNYPERTFTIRNITPNEGKTVFIKRGPRPENKIIINEKPNSPKNKIIVNTNTPKIPIEKIGSLSQEDKDIFTGEYYRRNIKKIFEENEYNKLPKKITQIKRSGFQDECRFINIFGLRFLAKIYKNPATN